jgi:hypothetical protein
MEYEAHLRVEGSVMTPAGLQEVIVADLEIDAAENIDGVAVDRTAEQQDTRGVRGAPLMALRFLNLKSRRAHSASK